MYGMINEAIRDYLLDQHGPEVWDAVSDLAGCAPAAHTPMPRNDPELTGRLVTAISALSGLGIWDVEAILGRHWVVFSDATPYGNVLRQSGANFSERVARLGDTHRRLAVLEPDIDQPQIDLTPTGAHRFVLEHCPKRASESAMVLGLLHGLAETTGESITVKEVFGPALTRDRDMFEITVQT